MKIILYLGSAFFIQFTMEYILSVRFELYDYSNFEFIMYILGAIFFTGIFYAQIGFSIYTLLVDEKENNQIYYKTLLINIIQLIIIIICVLLINITKTDFIVIVLNIIILSIFT